MFDLESNVRALYGFLEQGTNQIAALKPFDEDVCFCSGEKVSNEGYFPINKPKCIIEQAQLEGGASSLNRNSALGPSRLMKSGSVHARRSLNDQDLAIHNVHSANEQPTQNLMATKFMIPARGKECLAKISKSTGDLYDNRKTSQISAFSLSSKTIRPKQEFGNSRRSRYFNLMADKTLEDLKVQRVTKASHDFRFQNAVDNPLIISGRGRNPRPQHDYELTQSSSGRVAG